MFELERLRPDHEAAILDFELANRAYFAGSISDRGDDFYEHFAERYRALLAEQEAGLSIGHVLVDEHETVVGRFNLYALADGTAEVGYRIAQRVAGRGVATIGLRRMCRLARDEYGLRTLRAATSNENAASRRVLTKAGFVGVGPVEVGGRQGMRYELALASLRPTAVIARAEL
ncbi:MAG: GNAT family N-acetyltransferase [Candidatus Dormibacteria bacterium]